MSAIYEDENGFVWMVNLIDVTDLPAILRSAVASWLDTDREPFERSGRVDDIWYPLKGDDAEQLAARRDMLREDKSPFPTVRVKGRRSLP